MDEEIRRRILDAVRYAEKIIPVFGSADMVQMMPPDLLNSCADTKKAVERLKRKLQSDDWFYLPVDLSEFVRISGFYRNGRYEMPSNLRELIEFIVRALDSKNYEKLAFYVRILVVYEMMYGFWNPSKKGNSDVSIDFVDAAETMKKVTSMAKSELENVRDLKDRLKSQLASVADSENRATALSASASEKVAEITMLFDQLGAQRKGLEELRESILVKVNDAENKNNQLAASVAKYQEDGDKLLKELTQKTKQVYDQIDEVGVFVESANSKVNELNQKSEEGLKDVEKNLNETKESVAEVKKMMGYIGDGTLGHSFKKQREIINSKATFWLVTSLVLFIAAIAWIIVVFTVFDPPTEIVWANIVINAIKSSLAVVAFGYALNEYGKERNLQEEYAFRESIALTLNAYLNRLDACDKDEMKKLLADTVEKLYTKPVISSKEYKMMQMEPKEIAEMLKPIADVVKPFAGKE